MAKTGRPSLLETRPEITAEICKLLASGAPLETCAEAIGVWSQTLREWLAKARECLSEYKGDISAAETDEAKGIYVAFASAVSRAEALAELSLLDRVLAAGKGGWAAGWVLERVRRHRYSTRAESAVDARVKVEGGEDTDLDERAKARMAAFLAGSERSKDGVDGRGTGGVAGEARGEGGASSDES